MISFITGSRSYRLETVTKETDIDLVIYVDANTKQRLIDLSDTGKMPCKYGKLNLIFATSPEEWAAWFQARQMCRKVEGASKQEHYELHEAARLLFGTNYDHESGEPK